jgi:hypothetical protein
MFIYQSLGRSPVKLTPGLNLAIPFYHQITALDVRESSVNIPNVRTAQLIRCTSTPANDELIINSYRGILQITYATRSCIHLDEYITVF